MIEFQVTCVTKKHPLCWFGEIEVIGSQGGQLWTPDVMAYAIREWGMRFFTVDDVTGKRAYVVPKQHANGTWYVATAPDASFSNNLLNQTTCPTGAY